MNILYFANYYPHTSGAAAAICTHKITESLANFGHEVLVLAPGGKGKSFDIKTSKKSIEMPNLHLKTSTSLIKFPFNLNISHFENAIRFLTKLKSTFQPDLILSQYHTFHYASVMGGYISQIMKIPHAIRSHDIFIDLKSKSLLFKLLFSINYPQIYHSISKCDIDYVQTTEMKEYLQKIKKFQNVKFKILHNGIDLDLFYPARNTEILKKRYGCDTIISFIGLISQDIGLHNFIKILPDVLKTHKDTHMVIIGDGPYKNYVLNLITKLKLNKQVHFLGIKPHESIPFFINNSDIGIARITHEKLWRFFVPVKCLEYMACKKPFITTPISQDVIKNNDVGLVIKKDFSNKELIEHLLMLIEDKGLRTKLGENGFKKIFKDFNWKTILDEFNQDLQNLIDK